MNLKMDGAAEPLGFKVLLVQMFKAALSYLRSFSKVFPYPLGSCEKKMLISHSLLTTSLPDPASTIHLLVASRKRSIGKCVPGRCWHDQGLLLPTTKPHSELAIAVQSSQVQGSSGCVCMLTPKPCGEIQLSVPELQLGRPCSLIPDLADQLGSFVFSALKYYCYYHYY